MLTLPFIFRFEIFNKDIWFKQRVLDFTYEMSI